MRNKLVSSQSRTNSENQQHENSSYTSLVLAGLVISQGANFLFSLSESTFPAECGGFAPLSYVPIVAGLSFISAVVWSLTDEVKNGEQRAALISATTLSGAATGALHLIPRLPWFGASLIGAGVIGLGYFFRNKINTPSIVEPEKKSKHYIASPSISDDDFLGEMVSKRSSHLELGLLMNEFPSAGARPNGRV